MKAMYTVVARPVWRFVQKIIAFDASGGDWFGTMVVMNEEYLAVTTQTLGVIYMYALDNTGAWVFLSKLTAGGLEVPVGDTSFGSSLAMSGAHLVV
jgi:hypothetical protein